MGRHRAPTPLALLLGVDPTRGARAYVGEPAGEHEPGTAPSRPAGRRGASRMVGRVALTAVLGSAAAAVATLIPADRLAVPPADAPTPNVALAAPGAQADTTTGARSTVTPVISGADADQARRSRDLTALAKATNRSGENAGPPAAAQRPAAARAAFVRPVTGRITSNFGPRWGTTHYGLDIANRIGTPVRSVGAGTVIDAGPASGFGLWVRVRLTDGTITVYGHINRALVSEGDRVASGDVIAEVGNRGKSTGPHLHFEAISPGGAKQDPLAWLERRGAGDVAA